MAAVLAAFQVAPVADSTPAPSSEPALLFSDDFERTAYTLGPDWDLPLGGWKTGGRAVSDRSSVENLALARTTDRGDCRVEASLITFGVSHAGLLLRAGGGDRYELVITSSSRLQIRKVVGGTRTVLADVASGLPALTRWTVLALEARGGTLEGYLDGALKVVAEDSTPLSAGRAGLIASVAGVPFDLFRLWSVATPETDGGTPLPDSGTALPDAGAPAPDAGAPAPDAGAAAPDAGAAAPDAGAAAPDAGAAAPDAGAAAPDAGVPTPGAGVPTPDAGVPTPDGGMPTPDAGTWDAGIPAQDSGIPLPPDDGSPPPGGILFSDSFSRGDGALGSNWTMSSGYVKLKSQRAVTDRSRSSASASAARCVQCKVTAQVLGFGVSYVSLFARAPSPTSQDRYELALGGGGELELRRILGGTTAVLGSAPSGLDDLGSVSTLSLEVSGTGPVTLRGWVNGVLQVTAEDSSSSALFAEGYSGVAASSAGVWFDDFVLEGSGTAPPPAPADGGTPLPDAGAPTQLTPWADLAIPCGDPIDPSNQRCAGAAPIDVAFAYVLGSGSTFYVSPGGNDANDGTTLDTPWRTINHAVRHVAAGDVIRLMSGTYVEDVSILGEGGPPEAPPNGTASAPITLTIDHGAQATLQPTRDVGAVIDLAREHWILKGLNVTAGGTRSGGILITQPNNAVVDSTIFAVRLDAITLKGNARNILLENNSIAEVLESQGCTTDADCAHPFLCDTSALECVTGAVEIEPRLTETTSTPMAWTR